MLILRVIMLFWGTTKIGLHALMIKKHISLHILSGAAALRSPSVCSVRPLS